MKKPAVFLTLTLCLAACGGQNNSGSFSSSASSSSSTSSSSSASSSSGISQEEVAAYFAQYACGVNFSAMGSTDFTPCYRTPAGRAECIVGDNDAIHIEPVTWDGSDEPVTDVLHVSGGGSKGIGISVITADGKLFFGAAPSAYPRTQVESGSIIAGGSYRFAAALVRQDGRNKVFHEFPEPELPEDFDAMQLTGQGLSADGNYCALNAKGEVWCFGQRDSGTRQNFSAPVKFIAHGDESLCGVRFDGTVECLYRASPQQEPPQISLEHVERIFPVGDAFITVQVNGQAHYHGEESVLLDIGRIVASTGSTFEGLVIVATENGDVYEVISGPSVRKIPGAKAQVAECPY